MIAHNNNIKVFIDAAKGAVRLDSYPSLTSIHIKTSPTNQDFHILAEASFDPELVQHAGAPQKVWLEIRSPADSDDLFVEVVWVDKAATRMPETVWLQWQPNPDSGMVVYVVVSIIRKIYSSTEITTFAIYKAL